MPRLLLVNPSNERKGLGNTKATAWPPLNLPYIAALTPKHYDIALIDENIEPFSEQPADLVGITAYTSSVSRGYEIAQLYKAKSIPVVMGGIHVSMLPDEALRFCDAVVIGEAESVWADLLQDFEAGCLKPKYQGNWQGLEDLPIPRRDILKNSYYRWGSMQTSRGCPMNCDFCSVTAFNGNRFRRRPVGSVIAELRQIPQKLVLLADDNIIGYGKKEAEWA
ncbi:MAG: cobalamin-dependent protein, partial [Desulfobacteraceae bacterium]|nr:cobalamin-dependent protein [Desulfobacteraceae bacterium]